VRRVLLATLGTVVGVVLLLSLKPHNVARLAALPLSPAPSPSGHGAAPDAGKSRNAAAKRSAAPARRTVTGGTVTTPYGPMQVKVSLDARTIVAIKAVQVPTDGQRSRMIAEFAVPQLTHEALSVQSAQIDAVSGATYTSQGYMQSLQSALDRAGV
jgi:uncharacterized protein with FMN-binding domain